MQGVVSLSCLCLLVPFELSASFDPTYEKNVAIQSRVKLQSNLDYPDSGK